MIPHSAPLQAPGQIFLLVLVFKKQVFSSAAKFLVCYYFLKNLCHHILFHTSNYRYKEDKRHNLLICICSVKPIEGFQIGICNMGLFNERGGSLGNTYKYFVSRCGEGHEFEATVNLALINRKWISMVLSLKCNS